MDKKNPVDNSTPSASTKKQIPLRLSEQLYVELSRWAEADFRSVNGQIEYLLTLCVKEHNKSGKYLPDFNSEDK